MPTHIKTLLNGSRVEFDIGSFDAWCVYVTPPGGVRFAPTDVQYFSRLQALGEIHGHEKIYNDFISFYNATNARLDTQLTDKITAIAQGYGEGAHEIEQWFTVIYAGMVAEENKEKAILKKRIKRLGMHQVLMEGEPANFAAHFSRGKKWRDLDAIMRQKGF